MIRKRRVDNMMSNNRIDGDAINRARHAGISLLKSFAS
jgi:hypothetical protein